MPSKNESAKGGRVSRQTLWQRRHRELGLCVVCSEPAFKGWRCVKHYEQHKINMRFRYIPRVRGRYNVGGATALPAATPTATKPTPKRARVVGRTGSTSPRRGSTSAKRYAKA